MYFSLAHPSKGGVTAALLAEEGYVGDIDPFSGDFGFWQYIGCDSWSHEAVMKEIGKRWYAQEISYKQYPAGL